MIFPDSYLSKLRVKSSCQKITGCQSRIIQRIRDLFDENGIEFQEYKAGIQLNLDQLGLPKSFFDIYLLKSNPEHIRGRIKRSVVNGFNIDAEGEDFSIHTQADLEYLRNELQKIISEVIKIGRFYYFGSRGTTQYYYARITADGEITDFVLRGKFAEKAMAQLKGVDSKIFRQALDTHGIPRSSIVRLSLTRIFRGAADIEELFAVVCHEAERIVNADEWKTLRELKENSQFPFLGNIICILWEEVTRIYMKKAWLSLHK